MDDVLTFARKKFVYTVKQTTEYITKMRAISFSLVSDEKKNPSLGWYMKRPWFRMNKSAEASFDGGANFPIFCVRDGPRGVGVLWCMIHTPRREGRFVCLSVCLPA